MIRRRDDLSLGSDTYIHTISDEDGLCKMNSGALPTALILFRLIVCL